MVAANFPLLNPVTILLEAKSDINHSNNQGLTPLIVSATQALLSATWGKHIDIVKYLLQSNAEIETKNFKGNTPLLAAIINNHYEMVLILLENGANQQIYNNQSETPLTLTKQNLPHIYSLLLQWQ